MCTVARSSGPYWSSVVAAAARTGLRGSGSMRQGATPIAPCPPGSGPAMVGVVPGAVCCDHRWRRRAGRDLACHRGIGVPGLRRSVAPARVDAGTLGAHPRRPAAAASGAGALRRLGLWAHPGAAASVVCAGAQRGRRDDRVGADRRGDRCGASAHRCPAGASGGHGARLAARCPLTRRLAVRAGVPRAGAVRTGAEHPCLPRPRSPLGNAVTALGAAAAAIRRCFGATLRTPAWSLIVTITGGRLLRPLRRSGWKPAPPWRLRCHRRNR